jgi:SAM-dependent methyltransferase
MDDYQTSRNKAFAQYAQKHFKGIEIGASYRPTFPKVDGYSVTVVDHCNTADLIAKYKADITIPDQLVAQIETVDVVWSGNSYKDLPGLAGSADYVAACHVIEHATDVCGFLKDCASLLKPGGRLLLAIPDRACILDFYRPLSTLGDVLLAHVAPHAYDLKSRMDEAWYGSLLDGGGAWGSAHYKGATAAGRVPLPQHAAAFGMHVWASNTAQPFDNSADRPYRDAHRWVFDSVSFSEIALFLELNAGTGLHVESMPGTFGCEFYAVLRKVSEPVVSVAILESQRLVALRSRLGAVFPG